MNDKFKVRPALFKFSGISWTWVSLKELADIIGLTPFECWSRYFWCTSESFRGRPHLYAYWEGNNNPEARKDEYHMTRTEAETAFVPAGWANYVLEEWKRAQTNVVDTENYTGMYFYDEAGTRMTVK